MLTGGLRSVKSPCQQFRWPNQNTIAMFNSILKNGKVRTIRNLRPVLDHARKAGVDRIVARQCQTGGKLDVHYFDGSFATIDFASFEVLKRWVLNPRGWVRSRRSCGLSVNDISIIEL